MEQALFWLGRILMGGYFLFNAFNHFANVRAMSGYAASKGVPAPAAAVIVTGLLLAAGGLAILLGRYTQIGLWALVLFFVVVTPWMHAFWAVQDPTQRMAEQIHFLKNLALLGSVLLLLYFWQP
ncbi:MAG: DoxX family membrane protein [Bacteroidetes bacterium]|nr:DoxX family membrane protein [Rhodothermia bacterium]MCS7155957.1 DoxX family membrane protein [Bacteroidota bacterium]MCX7905963.1 DoxX family membrane protein [Bacteroidota bacterium]MDW8138070.1 DoxX family membrane protein [Bacteroidota bacterium]MDW8285754.1 DoxX family membrane protein [Bacteroidota bacterium]